MTVERSWDYYRAVIAVCDAEERVMEATDQLATIETALAEVEDGARLLQPGIVLEYRDRLRGPQGEVIFWVN
jgi:hypothetical protein